MKKLFIILMGLMISISAIAQEELKPLTITKVVQCEGKTATELYSLVKQWMLTFYNAPEKVIQLDDPNNNYLGCTAATDFKFMSGLSGIIRYNLIIETRDGRLRFQLKNIIHSSTNGDNGDWCNLGTIYENEKPYSKGMNHGQKNRANAAAVKEFIKMGESIELTLKDYVTKASADTNDDW